MMCSYLRYHSLSKTSLNPMIDGRSSRAPKWGAYRRISEGFLGEDWYDQPFFPMQKVTLGHRAIRTLKDAVPLSVRKKLARA